MNCPVCSKPMLNEDFGKVHVDVCKNGCKGIWFDWMELIKLDENNEGFGNALQEALKYPRTNDENRPKVNCPKCAKPLQRHLYKSKKEINIDECYLCGGIFLDSGEFVDIRDNRMTEAEETEYLDKLLKEIPTYQKALMNQKKTTERANALNRLTKFLRVSYYNTGN